MNVTKALALSVLSASLIAGCAVLAAAQPPGFPQLYNVSLEIEGEGTVSVDPAPPSAPSEYSGNAVLYYADPASTGLTIQATADASDGWRFVRWELGQTGSTTPATANPATLNLVPGGGSPSEWTLRALFVEAEAGWLDDVESGANGWVGTGTRAVTWHITQRRPDCPSPTHAWWFGDESAGTYRSGSRRVQGTLTSPAIPVPAGAVMRVSFQHWRHVEAYAGSARDKTWVEVSVGGGAWQMQWSQDSRNASQQAWEEKSFEVAVPAGVTSIQIRFSFDSVNSSNNAFPGWFIDDIRVALAPLRFVISPERVVVPEGDTAGFGVRLSGPPSEDVGAEVVRLAGDTDLDVNSGATLAFDAANWATEQRVTLEAAEDQDQDDETATFRVQCTLGGPIPNKDVVAKSRDKDAWLEDAEKGLNGWVGTGTNAVTWHITQRRPDCPSPTHAWWFGDESTGTYRSGSRRVQGTLTSPAIPVLAGTTARVSFQQWRHVEAYARSARDKTWVEVSVGGGAWQTQWSQDSRNASQKAWEEKSFEVAVPVGVTSMQIRFCFDSVNSSNNALPGWFIDDARLEDELWPPSPPAGSSEEALDPPADSATFRVDGVRNTPNPVTDVHTTRFEVMGVGIEQINVQIYDLSGRLVFESGWQPNGYEWHVQTTDGQTVANGVYLYVLLVRGVNGQLVRSEVSKLAVHR